MGTHMSTRQGKIGKIATKAATDATAAITAKIVGAHTSKNRKPQQQINATKLSAADASSVSSSVVLE